MPALEGFVRSRTQHHDPGFLGQPGPAGEPFVHAHVTLLAPFDSLPDEVAVTQVLARHRAFDYVLRRLAVFGNGIIHARPEPEDHFRRLTADLRTAFPGVLPYRGLHPVAPHVTLEAQAPGVDLPTVRQWTSRVLPARTRAEAVDLVWYESGSTRLLRRWRLDGVS